MVVVAAVDRTDRASKVVEEASALAEAFDLPLHVVHVLSASEFVDLERTSYNETGETISMDEVNAIAGEFAEEAAAGVSTEFKAIGMMGEAAEEVIDYATEQDAQYIVVGPRKKSPTGKALFGSVAQSVLMNAPCTVATTPPTS